MKPSYCIEKHIEENKRAKDDCQQKNIEIFLGKDLAFEKHTSNDWAIIFLFSKSSSIVLCFPIFVAPSILLDEDYYQGCCLDAFVIPLVISREVVPTCTLSCSGVFGTLRVSWFFPDLGFST